MNVQRIVDFPVQERLVKLHAYKSQQVSCVCQFDAWVFHVPSMRTYARMHGDHGVHALPLPKGGCLGRLCLVV